MEMYNYHLMATNYSCQAINHFKRVLTHKLTHQFDRFIYVVCCRQRTTTCLIYKMEPLSNLPSNNVISLSTEIFLE